MPTYLAVLQDCSIELTVGRRYGLIGQNGSGKTNFLQVLANREVSQLDGPTSVFATASAPLQPRQLDVRTE